MPRSLPQIPERVPIVEAGGIITTFFRLRWQQLQDAFSQVPSLALVSKALTAALATTTLWTTKTAGTYRITIYLRVTTPATTSSSVTVTIGWLESGVALSKTFPAVTGNLVTTIDVQTLTVKVDAASNLTIATSYASVGVTPLAHRLDGSVEQIV